MGYQTPLLLIKIEWRSKYGIVLHRVDSIYLEICVVGAVHYVVYNLELERIRSLPQSSIIADGVALPYKPYLYSRTDLNATRF